MNFFSDYIKAFKAEWLKLRNSGTFWLVLIMAAFIPAIFTLVGLLQTESDFTFVASENSWKRFVTGCFQGFGLFFFPIFLTLLVIRLTQMEHRGGGWKLIEVQPISKPSLYLSKFSISVVVAFLCIVALLLFSLLGGTIVMLVKNSPGFTKHSIPFEFITRLGLRLLIAGLGILGIQYLFSVVISGFLWPFSIGLVGTITGTILFGMRQALWWPYIAPGMTITNPEGSSAGNFLMYYEWLSIAWMVTALWLGYQWYVRKTFKRAFFKPTPRILHMLVPVVLFALVFIYINKPVQLPSHSRTAITGTVESKDQFQTAYLFAEPLMDTVLEIPITDNRFSVSTDKSIPAGVYSFRLGAINQKIFFGNKDSLFLKVKIDGINNRVTSSGTRNPENEYLRNGSDNDLGSDKYMLERYGSEMKPKVFAAEVMRLWNEEVDNLDNFKTADNLKPNNDFIALQKKLLSLYYIKLLDGKYAQWFRIYNPTETLEFPKSVDAIRNAVNYNDSTLLSYSVYRDNIADYYQQKYKLNPSNDTAYISKVATVLPASTLRDYLVFNKIKGLVGRTRDSASREMLIAKYLPVISQQKTQQQILTLNYILNSLTRGSTAPDFITTALNKDTFSLKNFKGRYVVIDIWATWCRTCTAQSAVFEKIAEEYTSPAVAFVALSIDDSRWAWQDEASQRSLSVLHLRSINKDLFSRSYGVDYMPRYILIDPDGKILYAQLPKPSNPAFTEILRREIPGLEGL